MIRYKCSQCGKSLKATDVIIGRKAKCTRCGNIEEVPPFSTRKSRSKRRREQKKEVVSVDSDSSFDLEDLKSLRSGKLTDSVPDLVPMPAVEKQSPVTMKIPEQAAPAPNQQEFQPVFKRAKAKRKLSQKIVAITLGLLTLVVVGYLVTGSLGLFDATEESVTGFAQTKEMIEYENALFELKKAQRVMVIMSNGYMSAKGVGKSELGDLDQLVVSLDQVTADESTIESAHEIFESGDATEAKRMVVESTRQLVLLREEVAQRTEDFRQKTYQ